MKIVSFHSLDGGSPRCGALICAGEEVLDFDSPAADLPRPEGPLAWLDRAGRCLPAAYELVRSVEADPARLESLRAARAVGPLAAVRLAAPVPRPGKVLCIGLNYRDHAAEARMEIPEYPLVFSKFASCVVGPGEVVKLPPGSRKVDYEAELGVVVGRRASRVPEGRALEHVLGYTNVNDVTARDFQFADGQWQRSKSCDTFCPTGPWIATTEEVPAPEQLDICFRLNGETLQDSNTDQLIFGVAKLVSFLSGFVTLEPGDLIATGTPAGVGFARKPPVYVQSGDRMEVEVEGLGVLENGVRG